MESMKCISNCTEISRVVGIPIQYVLTRRSEYRTLSQIYNFKSNTEHNMVIPTKLKTFKPKSPSKETIYHELSKKL